MDVVVNDARDDHVRRPRPAAEGHVVSAMSEYSTSTGTSEADALRDLALVVDKEIRVDLWFTFSIRRLWGYVQLT
jgi:hypothetical protein